MRALPPPASVVFTHIDQLYVSACPVVAVVIVTSVRPSRVVAPPPHIVSILS